VRKDPFLGRLVVVRRHDKQAVGTGLCGGPGAFDRVGSVVAAGAGDDVGPVTHSVNDDTDKVNLLGVRGGGRLTGRAVDNQTVVTVVNEVHSQLRGAFQVERTIGFHRGDHGREDSAEQRHLRHVATISPSRTKVRNK